MNPQAPRHILHVDLDAFFAAVEQRDRPELRGKPVLVGGDPRGRGVVSTASYEARTFGCRSAMPMAKAIRLCPSAIIVSPRMDVYADISQQVMALFELCTPMVEPLSIDEAFLDISGSVRLLGPPEAIAEDLRQRIHKETGLTASAGLAPNMFLAKLASDLNKPDGLTIVPRHDIQGFLDPLPISRMWGVGKVTLPKLQSLGIRTFGDMRGWPEHELTARFGESGGHFFKLARGIDDRTVQPDNDAKSLSHEVTFADDVADDHHLRTVLLHLTDQVARRLRRHARLCKTVQLKIRTADFSTNTRAQTVPAATDQTDTIWPVVRALFESWRKDHPSPVRLIGASVTNLVPREGHQLELFDQFNRQEHSQLDQAVDCIRDRFGERAITRGGPPASKSRPPKGTCR